MRTVAALFVHPQGPYVGLADVDPWDEARDARRYAGPHPVVAHPPCHLWVNLAAVNFKRWGHVPAWYPGGTDGGCFAFALDAVRRWGGVLEHPAGSHAWRHHHLTRPTSAGWTLTGPAEWVCEVCQSAYGHLARKRTWLFYAGAVPPPGLRWENPPGSHQIGWFDRNRPTLNRKRASETPTAFRDQLLSIARTARQEVPSERAS